MKNDFGAHTFTYLRFAAPMTAKYILKYSNYAINSIF